MKQNLMWFLISFLMSCSVAACSETVLASAIQKLNDKDAVVRRSGAEELVALGSDARRVASGLLKKLDDPDQHVRNCLVKVLAKIGPTLLPDLLQALRNANPDIRIGAAEVLGANTESANSASTALVALMTHEREPLVRGALARALGRATANTEANLARLIDSLNTDSSIRVQTVCVQALAEKGPIAASALPVLISRFKEPDRIYRLAILDALARIGPDDPTVVSIFVEALKDPQYIEAALYGLSQTGSAAKTAIPSIVAMLSNKNVTVRVAAASTLGKLGPLAKQAVPQLATALADPFPPVVKASAEALGNIGADGIPSLLSAVMSSNLLTRHTAQEVLKVWNGPQEVIAEALRSTSVDRRIAAARTLERTRPLQRNSVAFLVDALTDKQADVRQAAEAALVANIVDSLPTLVHALKDERDERVIATVATIGKAGVYGSDTMSGLIRTLDHSNFRVRCAGAEALGQMGPLAADAVPALARLIEGSEAPTRAAGARALARIGWSDDQLLARLCERLQDSEPAVRASSALALGRATGSAKKVVPLLIVTIKDAESSVRAAGVSVLGVFGPEAEDAFPQLRAMVNDTDPEVRSAVAKAIGGIAKSEALEMLASFLQDSEAGVRIAALHSVRALGEAALPLVPELIRALGDADSEKRAFIIGILSKSGVEGQNALVAALSNTNSQASREVFYALKALKPLDKVVVGTLLKHLKEGSALTQRYAVELLSNIGVNDLKIAKTATEILVAKETNDELRQRLVRLLAQIGPDASVALEPLVKILQESSPELHKDAARALIRMGPFAIPALKQIVDSHPVGRSAVLNEIGDHPEAASQTKEILFNILMDPNRDGQNEAFLACVSLGAAVVPDLCGLLEDQNITVRHSAIRTLRLMGLRAQHAVPKLIEVLGSPEGPQVSEILANMGMPAATALLKTCLDANSQVRKPAMDALLKMKVLDPETIPQILALLDIPESTMQQNGLALLAKCGSANNATALVVLTKLKSNDMNLRTKAAIVLESINEGRLQDIEALGHLLSDKDWAVRYFATRLMQAHAEQAVRKFPGFKAAQKEVSAWQAAHKISHAQRLYFQSDWDGDGIFEYAQRLRGVDSLYETSKGAGDLLLINKELALADTSEGGTAYNGYFVKLLKAQGPRAKAGRITYNLGENMTRGFAIMLYPEESPSDLYSFCITQTGEIRRKRFGAETHLITSMTEFDPDESWEDASLPNLE